MKLRLLVLLVLVVGCGQAAATPSKTVAESVYLVGSNAVVGVDGSSGRQIASLPMAVAGPGWKWFAATAGSQLLFYGPGGEQVAGLDLPGPYELPQTTFDGKPGGLSPDGGRLVLTRVQGGKSSFLLVNTRTRLIEHRADFDGRFEFDGIDDSGTRLYLIHRFADQPTKYEVAKYSFATRELQAPIVEKTGRLRVMEGDRVSAVTDPGGHWQYSLYRGGAEGAFIHALMLDADYGAAWCVDLPGGGSLDQQLAWSITMSPDGRQLYALNPVLNQALSYSVADTSVGQPPALHRQAGLSTGAPFGIGASVLSPDRSGLAVALNGGILVLDPDTMGVRGRWANSQVFRSLAASPDGVSIYGLTASGLVRIDPRSGRTDKPVRVRGTAILGVRAV